jgi:hypothetical protein
MSAIIQANPLEKLSQEPLPTGDSCVLIIFGASGDLTKRKLIPGLYNLACEGCMNPEFEVLGIGRTPISSEEFRKKTGEAAAKSKDTRDFSESGWTDFQTRLHLRPGSPGPQALESISFVVVAGDSQPFHSIAIQVAWVFALRNSEIFKVAFLVICFPGVTQIALSAGACCVR